MGRATKVKVRCGILDGAALDCARQEFWALFAGIGGGSLVTSLSAGVVAAPGWVTVGPAALVRRAARCW